MSYFRNQRSLAVVMVILLAIPLLLLVIEEEGIKDLFVNVLTILALVVALYFNRLLKEENGWEWMSFSILFVLFWFFVFQTRLWDYMAIVKELVDPEIFDPSLAKSYAKIGERLSVVLMGTFAIYCVRELYQKMMKEIGLT